MLYEILLAEKKACPTIIKVPALTKKLPRPGYSRMALTLPNRRLGRKRENHSYYAEIWKWF